MPLENIAPKPTVYRGITFRSRLESRWAVYFDTLRLKWSYEPYPIKLSGGHTYTPDFLVMGAVKHKGLWEVKPSLPTDDVYETLKQVSRKEKTNVFLAYGSFYNNTPTISCYNRFTDSYLTCSTQIGAAEAAARWRFDLA